MMNSSERMRLLADLREYVSQSQELVSGLRELEECGQAVNLDLHGFAETGGRLVQRLDTAMEA